MNWGIKMGLIKLAQQEYENGGIAGFTQNHPLLTAGIALTGGIAAADVATGMFKNKMFYNKPLMEGWKHNLAEGAVYGGALSLVEPAILHGVFRKEEK